MKRILWRKEIFKDLKYEVKIIFAGHYDHDFNKPERTIY